MKNFKNNGRFPRFLAFLSAGKSLGIAIAFDDCSLSEVPKVIGWVMVNGEANMLILSRKIGERIRIGNGTGANAIEVIVQRVAGDRVTLGIAAPAHVKILRSELALPDDLPLANHSSPGSSDLGVSEPVAVF